MVAAPPTRSFPRKREPPLRHRNRGPRLRGDDPVLLQLGWGDSPHLRCPNRHAFILPTPSVSAPLSPISKNLCPVIPGGLIFTPSPRICEVATNGLRGESGITGVVPWWANVGAEAGKAESSALQRRMPESTPTRRRDEGPINCRLPAWTLVPPRPLLTTRPVL